MMMKLACWKVPECLGGLVVIRARAFVSGVLLATLVFTPASALAASEGDLELPKGSRIDEIATLEGLPWGMDWLSESELIVTLKSGQFVKLGLSFERAPRGTQKAKVSSLGNAPAALGFAEAGQGGLLDVKVSPNFSSDRSVYFTYSKFGKLGITTAFARFRLSPKTGLAEDFEDLYVANAWGRRMIHFGSRIAFGPEQTVFISVGDRGERDKAQDLSLDAGKILRLKRDGSVPGDNPFVKQAGASAAVYSFGHRNPQGLFYNASSRELFAAEHGPRGGDEINQIRAGRNYGWPVITYGREYSGPKIGKGTHEKGMEQPQKVYVPSIAPSSLIQLQTSTLPGFKGSFVLGALVLQHLNIVSMDFKTENRFLTKRGSRIRSVLEGVQGGLYLATDAGEILRLGVVEPKSSLGK